MLRVFSKYLWYHILHLNIVVETEHLIAQGNSYREQNRPDLALQCYAQAFVQEPEHVGAWNNYGNVIREMGYPHRSIPFLEHALRLDPNHSTAAFNLAVSLLLMDDYDQGWRQYESRWNFEHLAGTLPNFQQPRWQGQDIQGKKFLLIGEQGLGDTIQFIRFAADLHQRGALVTASVPAGVAPLIQGSTIISQVHCFGDPLPEFDIWAPMMSIPGQIGMNLQNLSHIAAYITPDRDCQAQWRQRLGPKHRLRVGFCWSGRRDTWINRHKAMPLGLMAGLIEKNPNYQWISLQVDANEEESQILQNLGCDTYPGTIRHMGDTAGLITNLDVVITVDTAVAHLSAALGANTWIMLNQYAVDWRYGIGRDHCPWYPTAKLFRQPSMGDWSSVIQKIHTWLDLFKI